MGNCQEICYSPPTATDLPVSTAKQIKEHCSETPAQQFSSKCQICGTEKQDAGLQKHLDLCHFVHVREKSSDEFEVTCLICEFKSTSLPQHKAHLSSRHSYMNEIASKNASLEVSSKNIESNQSLKSRVIQTKKNNVKINNDGQSCQIAGEVYDVYEFNGEYGAMEFNEDIVKGDLVWRHVFGEKRNASFYLLEFIPKMKSIQGIGKIYVKRGQKG